VEELLLNIIVQVGNYARLLPNEVVEKKNA